MGKPAERLAEPGTPKQGACAPADPSTSQRKRRVWVGADNSTMSSRVCTANTHSRALSTSDLIPAVHSITTCTLQWAVTPLPRSPTSLTAREGRAGCGGVSKQKSSSSKSSKSSKSSSHSSKGSGGGRRAGRAAASHKPATTADIMDASAYQNMMGGASPINALHPAVEPAAAAAAASGIMDPGMMGGAAPIDPATDQGLMGGAAPAETAQVRKLSCFFTSNGS